MQRLRAPPDSSEAARVQIMAIAGEIDLDLNNEYGLYRRAATGAMSEFATIIMLRLVTEMRHAVSICELISADDTANGILLVSWTFVLDEGICEDACAGRATLQTMQLGHQSRSAPLPPAHMPCRPW